MLLKFIEYKGKNLASWNFTCMGLAVNGLGNEAFLFLGKCLIQVLIRPHTVSSPVVFCLVSDIRGFYKVRRS